MSPDGRDGSIDSHQDGLVYAALLESGAAVGLDLPNGSRAYAQVARSGVLLSGRDLIAGDGARIQDDTRLEIVGPWSSEALVFDLPG
jgi:quercetin 2,3-dioxygenase